MTNAFAEARRRQLVRLGDAKPPAPRAAMALAKSQAYQDAADSPATLRAYAADLANYKAWCERHDFVAMPATPEVVGAYLAAAGEGYAMPTLRRRHSWQNFGALFPIYALKERPISSLKAMRS